VKVSRVSTGGSVWLARSIPNHRSCANCYCACFRCSLGVINEGLRRLVPNFAKDRKGQWVSFPILSSPYRESLQLGDAFRLIAGPLWDSPLRTVFALFGFARRFLARSLSRILGLFDRLALDRFTWRLGFARRCHSCKNFVQVFFVQQSVYSGLSARNNLFADGRIPLS